MFVLKTDFPSMFTRHPYFPIPLALHVRCRQAGLGRSPAERKIWVTNGVMVFAPLANSRRGRSAVAVRGE